MNLAFTNHRIWITLALLLATVTGMASDDTFCLLGQKQGLANDTVLQMTQLADGRMLIVTKHTIDIYNGGRFEHIKRTEEHWQQLPGYYGATNLIVDSLDRLWVKDWQRVACYDLKQRKHIKSGIPHGADDFFYDSTGRLWTLKERILYCGKHRLELPKDKSIVQNIDVWKDRLYAFFNNGQVIVYGLKEDKQLMQVAAYEGNYISQYANTSTVQHSKDRFYQVRTGGNGKSIFLCFDPAGNQWKTLLKTDFYLHTLIVTPNDMAYISTAEGYLRMNLNTNEWELITTLTLPDGSTISTGANTIYQDREGGIWLGTYHDGLLYSSPQSGMFDNPTDDEKAPFAQPDTETEQPWWNSIWTKTGLLLIVIGIGLMTIMIRSKRKQVRIPTSEDAAGQTIEHHANNEPSPQENEFIERATLLVEQHLSKPNYGVEQLAADLCMERTGLYRKLTALTQQSPVSFIRNIRLKHAADMILTGNRSITEIAEQTGFGSTSYFSKCFQKEYGCKPSDYKG